MHGLADKVNVICQKIYYWLASHTTSKPNCGKLLRDSVSRYITSNAQIAQFCIKGWKPD